MQICESEDSEVFYNILMQFSDILLSNDSNIVWGVIGPHDNVAVGEELFQFTANSGLVTVNSIACMLTKCTNIFTRNSPIA